MTSGVAELVKTLGSAPFEAEDEEVCFATKFMRHFDYPVKLLFDDALLSILGNLSFDGEVE